MINFTTAAFANNYLPAVRLGAIIDLSMLNKAAVPAISGNR